MERIWKWISILFGAELILIAIWWNALGIFESPNNKWAFPLIVSFFLPVILLTIASIWSTNLLKAMAHEVRSFNTEVDFKKLVTLLCKRGNGKATNDLIFLHITSADDYYARKELLKQDNYRWMIEKLIQSNRWNGTKHSHKDYLEKVRGIIKEAELKNFEKLYEELWKKSGASSSEEYPNRQKTFVQTEVLRGLWTLGYSSRYLFVERTPILFEGYEREELEELLQDYLRYIPFDAVPKAGRDDAKNAYDQFLLDVRLTASKRKPAAASN